MRLSEEYGVERFVLISSDKAVNPANVMRATKRLAELVVQEAARRTGLQVGRDIDVVFTGLRPAEKLFEELFVEGEEYYRTRHQKILGARDGYGRPAGGAVRPSLDEQVDLLVQAAREGAEGEVRRPLKEIVPNYMPAEG